MWGCCKDQADESILQLKSEQNGIRLCLICNANVQHYSCKVTLLTAGTACTRWVVPLLPGLQITVLHLTTTHIQRIRVASKPVIVVSPLIALLRHKRLRC